MAWNAKYDQGLKLVELVHTGVATAKDLQEATSKCIALGQENETNRFLVDAEELVISAQLADIYNLPDKQYVNEQVDRFSRIAVVRPRAPHAQHAAQFYETACVNRGWAAKIVSTRQEAIDWLGENTSS